MLQGNRPDPRIRRPYLAKLRATVEDVARRRQGRITFLVGDPGSGRSATLHALQEDLRVEWVGAAEDRQAAVGCRASDAWEELDGAKRIASRPRDVRHLFIHERSPRDLAGRSVDSRGRGERLGILGLVEA